MDKLGLLRVLEEHADFLFADDLVMEKTMTTLMGMFHRGGSPNLCGALLVTMTTLTITNLDFTDDWQVCRVFAPFFHLSRLPEGSTCDRCPPASGEQSQRHGIRIRPPNGLLLSLRTRTRPSWLCEYGQ